MQEGTLAQLDELTKASGQEAQETQEENVVAEKITDKECKEKLDIG